jgi:CRISPR system Cascade subunit CasD
MGEAAVDDALARLEELNSLRLSVILFEARAGSLWTDYHTVGGGHERHGFMPVSANRVDKSKTVVTHRKYLHDARFGAIWSGDAKLIASCEKALDNPVWGLWLGRKACIPASPLSRKSFASFEEALDALRKAELWRGREELKPLRAYSDADSFEDSSDSLMDLPVDFGRRLFKTRKIKEVALR